MSRTQTLTADDPLLLDVARSLGFAERSAAATAYARRASAQAAALRATGQARGDRYLGLLRGVIPGEPVPSEAPVVDRIIEWLDERQMPTVEDPGPGSAAGRSDMRIGYGGWPASRLGQVGAHWYRLKVDYDGHCPSGPCGERVTLHRVHPPQAAAIAADLDAALTF